MNVLSFLMYVVCVATLDLCITQDKTPVAPPPPFIVNNVCESNKEYLTHAVYEFLNAQKSDKSNKLILIGRLGSKESVHAYTSQRLRRVRSYIQNTWNVPESDIVAAEGERSNALASIELYASGKLITVINCSFRENVDLGYRGSCEKRGNLIMSQSK